MNNKNYIKYTLFGFSSETIRLCNNLGLKIDTIVDPSKKKHIVGYNHLKSDLKAISKLKSNSVIVSIDNCADRYSVFELLKKNKIKVLDVLGGINNSLKLGKGLFMQINTFISDNVEYGLGLRMNYGATVMHDCKIKNFVTIAPNATLLGNVKVGNNCYVGASATVLPNLIIGDNVIIGAGSVVTKNISDNNIVKGNPAI